MKVQHTITMLLLSLVTLGAGCTSKVTQPQSTPAFSPTTPANAVRLLEWCWNQRNANVNKTIFTDDFRFTFASADSAGSTYRTLPWTRADELVSERNLFVGGGTSPPARYIDLRLDPTLVPQVDRRPGKNPRWHTMFHSHVELTVRTVGSSGYTVGGGVTFFVVRGDSARIPPELAASFPPDSTRWWLERWDDDAIPGARPTESGITWGGLKTIYR